MYFPSTLLLHLLATLTSAAITSYGTKTTKTMSTSTAATPTVTLDYCKVAAAAGNASVGYFKYQNIRYAAIPTGTRRWGQPQWPSKSSGVNRGNLADADVDCSSSEDCLFVDVWAPANSAGKNLPVMVWTYGGGFTGGSKSQDTPEGLFDLSKEFVFVAYNYRLGMTGLANGPTFLHEGGTSNVALWDVQHAFQWTAKYIAAFGGDPEQITAVGFSAGASQTLFQLTRFSGHAPQLFKRMYVMSPGYVPGAGHHHSEQFWQNVSSTVGCDGGDLTCMRSVNFTTLQDAATTIVDDYTYQFQPRVDGDFVADTYEAQFYQNRFNFSGAAVITHELHEDNSAATSGVDTTADISTYLRIFFPAITDDVIEELLELYPESDYTSPGLRFADMRQSFDLTAHNLALTNALNNNTWNALVALGSATHGTDQNYYWYSTYTLSSSSSSSSSSSGGAQSSSNGTMSGSSSTAAPSGSSMMTMSGASASATSGSISPSSVLPSNSSTATTSSASSSFTGGPGGSMGGGGSSSVNSTIAIQMQKYLMSFVLTGNPNTKWSGDKLHWPKYSTSSQGAELVFNDIFYVAADNLANAKSLYWNKALWY